MRAQDVTQDLCTSLYAKDFTLNTSYAHLCTHRMVCQPHRNHHGAHNPRLDLCALRCVHTLFCLTPLIKLRCTHKMLRLTCLINFGQRTGCRARRVKCTALHAQDDTLDTSYVPWFWHVFSHCGAHTRCYVWHVSCTSLPAQDVTLDKSCVLPCPHGIMR